MHQENCDYLLIECTRDGCNESFLKQDIEKHEGRCSYKPLQSSYCQNDVFRMLKVLHEELCAKEKISCIYKEIGCSALICRKDIAKHENENQSLHTKLSFQKYMADTNELNVNLEQLKKENDNLKEELKKAKKEGANRDKQIVHLEGNIKRRKLADIELIQTKLRKHLHGQLLQYVVVQKDSLIVKVPFYGLIGLNSDYIKSLAAVATYHEKLETFFSGHLSYRDCLIELFNRILYHWYDIPGNNNQVKRFFFPVNNGQVEDFCCKYGDFMVVSSDNVIKVKAPLLYKIQIVIDENSYNVQSNCKFNIFEEHHMKRKKVYSSGCVVLWYGNFQQEMTRLIRSSVQNMLSQNIYMP